MKILFLCKRRYMSKDVIIDRYARLFEIPYQLSLQDNNVQAISLSYQNNYQGKLLTLKPSSSQTLTWYSFNIGRLIIPGVIKYLYQLKKNITEFKPEIIIGSSDVLHCVITYYLALIFKKKYVLDLYDNYESFGMAKIPGIKALYKKALKNADLITCVSQPLANYIQEKYKPRGIVEVMESTINKEDFFPQDKIECRKKLGLPQDTKIIGLAGALTPERGIESLYNMFTQLTEQYSEPVVLALAGPARKEHPVPEHPSILYLGELKHNNIVYFFNALDLAVILVMDNEFGRYSFPQKAFEILACHTPVICSNIGSMSYLLQQYPDCLFKNQNEFLYHSMKQLKKADIVNIPIETWEEKAQKLNSLIHKVL